LSTTEELEAAVARLVSTRVTGFGRTVDMVEVGFRHGAGETRLHAPCPFRVTRGDAILLGSEDMRFPATRDGDAQAAFRDRTTMFERKARRLTDRFEAVGYFVETAESGPAGRFRLQLGDGVVIEVLPACAGPVEQWRLFDRGTDRHYVFPDSADR
jgi:hypothetical protein